MKTAAAALLLSFGLSAAFAAAPIYRCGPDGRVYSQAPCADGRLIDAADPRSAAQRAEATRVAAQERKAAAALERERKAQAAAERPARATGFDARPPTAAASASQQANGEAKEGGRKRLSNAGGRSMKRRK